MPNGWWWWYRWWWSCRRRRSSVMPEIRRQRCDRLWRTTRSRCSRAAAVATGSRKSSKMMSTRSDDSASPASHSRCTWDRRHSAHRICQIRTIMPSANVARRDTPPPIDHRRLVADAPMKAGIAPSASPALLVVVSACRFDILLGQELIAFRAWTFSHSFRQERSSQSQQEKRQLQPSALTATATRGRTESTAHATAAQRCFTAFGTPEFLLQLLAIETPNHAAQAAGSTSGAHSNDVVAAAYRRAAVGAFETSDMIGVTLRTNRRAVDLARTAAPKRDRTLNNHRKPQQSNVAHEGHGAMAA